MIKTLTDPLRRTVRGWKRAQEYPILLPHFAIEPDGLRGPLGKKYPLDPDLLEVLKTCDGTRRLGEIGIPGRKLMEVYDQGMIILWHERLIDKGPEELVDTIILSPHPDDAALSVAHLLLASHGESVMVVDVFSQTAWWRFSESRLDVEEIQKVRFAEEQLVARLARAKLRLLDLPEALLRGYKAEHIFFDGPSDRDQQVQDQLRAALAEMIRAHPHAKWYLPAGVGGHIDHRIVRDTAAETLWNAGVRSVWIYEEMFYAAEKNRCDLPLEKMESENRPLDFKRKAELMRVYWSQFTAGRFRVVEEHARRIGHGTPAERVWHTPELGKPSGTFISRIVPGPPAPSPCTH